MFAYRFMYTPLLDMCYGLGVVVELELGLLLFLSSSWKPHTNMS